MTAVSCSAPDRPMVPIFENPRPRNEWFRWRLAHVCIVASLGVVGCGSSDEDASTTAPGATPAMQSRERAACASLRAAANAHEGRCGAPNFFPFDAVHLAHEAETCAIAIAAPGARIDASAVEACAAALRTAACDEGPAACAFPTGTLRDGAGCVSGVQCSGGKCVRATGAGCGQCAASGALGEACEPWTVGLGVGCGDNARCGWSATDFYGEAQATCLPRRIAREGEECDDQTTCAPTLSCTPNVDSGGADAESGRCEPALTEGTPCQAGARPGCVTGTTCIEGVCRPPGAEGEACAPDPFPNVRSSCDERTVCDSNSKRCRPPTFAGEGEACDLAANRCENGHCDATTRTCVRFRAVGEGCDGRDSNVRCEGLARCRDQVCALDDPARCE